MSRSLKDEIKKRGPFDSLEQEATLAIMRTSDLLGNRLLRLLRENGLTLTQYNVLRILRGEGKPLPCLEVASRMIQVAPAITRVVDQLLSMKLISKTQSDQDRRIYTVEIMPSGLELLKKIDQPILDLHARLLSNVPKRELKQLIQTLQAIRNGIAE